jgi:hypothetical protein
MLLLGLKVNGQSVKAATLSLAALLGVFSTARSLGQTTVSPASLSFPATPVGSVSAASQVTLTNKQATPLTIDGIAPSGSFTVSGTTCPLAPNTLGPNLTCTVALTFAPTETGLSAGTLTITDDAANSPAMVPLSGAGSTGGPTSVSPASLGFGSILIGQTSAAKSVTFTNNGASAITVSAAAASGDFTVSSNTCTASLAPAASCKISATFTPSATGARTGTLTITDSVDPSPVAVALSGSGVGPVTASPTALAFGSVGIGTASAIQNVTVTNNQAAAISITQIGNPGSGFSANASACGALPVQLTTGQSCVIAVTFTPAGAGAQAASLSITQSASMTPLLVSLTGSGVPPVSVSVTALNFGSIATNSTSAIKTFTLTNNQAVALNIAAIGIPAGNPFAIDPSTQCPNPGALAPGAHCTVAVTFTPTAAGAQNSSVAINDDASSSPQSVSLTGTGVNPVTLSPALVGYGAVVVGTASTAKTVTLKNNQTSPVSITSVLLGGPFSLDTSAHTATTCPTTGGSLGPLASCVIGLVFNPTAVGNANGQITVNDSAANSPQFTPLEGTGILASTLTPAASNLGSVVLNTTSAAKNFTLTNNQTVPLNLSALTLAAPYALAPATTTCAVGTPVPAKGSCVISVTLTPTALGTQPAGTLSVASDAANSPLTAALSGYAIGPVTLSPPGLNFSTVVVNTPVVKDVTLTNNQATPLSISSITGFSGGYKLDSSSTCPIAPLTVPAGASCVIAVNFTGTTTGNNPGSITINDNAPGSPQTFTLAAKSVLPVLLSPASLYFPAQLEGNPGTPQSITLTNEQAIPLNIASIAVTGTNSADYTVTSTCPVAPSSLPAGSSCGLSVTFNPSGSGTRTASLQISDDAYGSPQTVALSGAGNAPVVMSPSSITSFSAHVGGSSPYKTITITNTNAAAPVTFTGFQFNGDFEQTSTTCPLSPATLAGGASCVITVSFAPTIGGTRDGQLLISDNAITSPQVVNLSGNGILPLTETPGSLTYTAQKIGTVSAPKIVTLTNHESQQETFTLTPAGDFTATSSCGVGPTYVIPKNFACAIAVDFAPTAAGPRSGSLTITDSAPGAAPLVVSLLGSGTTTNPPAAVAVVSPGAATPASSPVTVSITGNGYTNFNASSVVTFSDTNAAAISSGITAAIPCPAVSSTCPVATTANQITAVLTIDPAAIFGARNIKVVTQLPGGGTETALLYSAFTVVDPSNAHTITNVAPSFGTQGQTLNVELTATGTHFVQGVTFANFGDGITVNNLQICGSPATPPTPPACPSGVQPGTDAIANITISYTTPVGGRTITVMTGGEVATSAAGAFTIGPDSAALVSINPTSAAQGASLPVTINATGTHFLQDATQVSLGGGIIVGNVQVVTPLQAIAQLAVTSGATVGLHDLTVSTGGETATLGNAFTVTGATPYLASVTPVSGQQGQTLSISVTGVYTNFTNLVADFGGDITVNSITPGANPATQATINITISQDAAVTSRTARLTSGPSGGETIFPFTFTVLPSSAQITSVTPNSVPQGGQVTLDVYGANTHWVQGTTMAGFPPIPVGSIVVNEVTVLSPTHAQLAISVSSDHPVGGHGFYIATGGEVVTSSISIYAQTPTLTMTPANGLPGTCFTVTFTGQFTHFAQGTTFPVVNGEGVTLSNFTVTGLTGATGTVCITATAPFGARTITFTTGGEIVTTYFNVTNNSASLYSVSPSQAPQSTTLTVELTGVNTHWVQGTTTVLFGPFITVDASSINVISPTDLKVNITTSYLNAGVSTVTPPGWQSVFVNTGQEQVIGGFFVDPPAMPTIVSVNPSSGAQGSSEMVTITGSGTNWTGATEFILGAGVTVDYPAVSVSPTSATLNISISPTAPSGSYSVTSITGSEIVTGASFGVTASAAEILSAQPVIRNCVGQFVAFCNGSSGAYVVAQLQTVTLNITAIGTHWLQGETSFSFGPGVVVDALTINSTTSATVQITVLSTAPVGFASLTSYTDGEVVTLQQAIDIEQGVPALLATAPGGAEQGATLNLQILGRFTNWQQGATNVAFNQDIQVNSVTVIDSDNLIANITVSPTAYVDGGPCGHLVTVTSGSEQVFGAINGPGDFCVAQGPAQITQVSPASGYQGSTEVVTITGSETHFIAGVTTANFGPGINVGNVAVNSPTSATVTLAVTTSAPTGYATATLTTFGEVATQQFAFQVSPGVATLNEAIPNQGEQGVQNLTVHLVGQYSHFNSNSTATFGNGITVNGVTFTDETDLNANISIDPLAYTGANSVTVTSPGVPCSLQPPAPTAALYFSGCTPGSSAGTGSEIVTAPVFSILPGPAIISQVAPATGNQGQEVIFNITGVNTHWAQSITQFYIAGAGSDLTIHSVVINSPTSATVDMTIATTANPSPRSVYMVTAGEALTDSGAFVVTGGIPSITSISPNNAPPGTSQLEVVIKGVYTTWQQGVTAAPSFGPGITVASYQVDDNFTIEAVLNIDPAAQNGYRTVVVTTGPQSLTSNFLVYTPPPPVPAITYYWPSSGLTGQTFTVSFSGSNTHWDPGPYNTPTTVTFGDGIAVNTFQVLSATSAVANITILPDTYPGSRLIVFTTGAETESAGFTVVSSTPGVPGGVTPTLSIVDPGSGMQGAQNLMVNILGQYTTFDSTTTFQFGPGITVNGPPTILGPTIATQSISIGQEAPLGGSAVTAITEGVAVSGAGFTITPSLALIAGLMPNTALQGNNITVEVTGQNTHWDGSTTFTVGSGIVVASAIVNSPTDATLVLSIPALAPLGATYARAQTGGEIASISNGFVVQAGTPLLLSSGPGSVPQQGSATFTILSQATTWTTNPPTVSYGAGIDLTNVTVTSDTSLTVDGFAEATTPTGYRDLTVTAGNQVLSLPYVLYVTPGPAVVNNITPSTGGQGGTYNIGIYGINTHWQQGVTVLNFPEVVVNSFTVLSPTSATANVTVSPYATPGLVNLTMTTLGEVAVKNNAFEITQTEPEMLYINAASAMQGQTATVTITSLYTHFGATTTASFGPGVTVNSVTPITATDLQVNVTVQPTAALGYRSVSVSTGTEVIASSSLFQVTTGPAAIYSLSPASGGQGRSLTVLVTGSQTNFASGVTTAAFGGGISVTGISVLDMLHANVNITIPNSTPVGAYNVTLTTGGEVATILGGFNVTAGNASLSAVNPPTGNQGASNLSVALTGLFTNFVNGTSVASFGAGITVNSTTVSGPTSAVANISISPAASLGSRTVTVTTNSEVASITGGFTVLAGVPNLTSAMPGSAQAGATVNVVVNGAFTSFQQGVSMVSFGSGITVNSVTVASATQLTANITVASNASVGSRDINVTTNSENVTLSAGFTVLPGTPVITVINPNIGNPGAGVSVTITGQYTNWGATTTASFGPGISVGGAAEGASGPVTVNSPTSLTATLTIDAAAALGPQDVTVTTGSEVETVPGGFTVQAATIPGPSVVQASPGSQVSNVSVNSSVTVVFSQPMDRTTINTSTVLLYLYSSYGLPGYTPVTGSVAVDATGRILTFTPSAPLAINTGYYFQLIGGSSGITDATGNTLTGSTSWYFWTASTTTTTAPTVVGFNPPALSTVGTNAGIELEFSTVMNESVQTGLTVSAGGTSVPGTYTWSDPSVPYWPTYAYVYCALGNPYYNNDSCPPGSLLTFTPASPLAPGTTYTVSYGSPLADTAGNLLTPGSFTFTTGSGPDTAYNYASTNITYNQTGIGTNVAPVITYSKPVNPLAINPNTVMLYNADSGKYLRGTVTVAPNGLSAQFTPAVPLLPNTYYDLHQSSGYYDADGNYLYGFDVRFTTGNGSDLVAPAVASVYPANLATGVPLNAQLVVHFTSPIDPNDTNVVTVTPAGGSQVIGSCSLGSDLVTLTCTSTDSLLGSTVYTVQVSGYRDIVGNTGATFTSTFTTATSVAPLVVSTGLDASGNLITTGDTPDAHWTVIPTATTPGQTQVTAPGTPQPLLVATNGQAGYYGGWPADGPNSSWVAINPDSVTGNTFGIYSTTFNLTGYSLNNLCLVGAMGVDDNGLLLINGNAIMSNIQAISSLTPLNLPIPSSYLVSGTNTLTLGWGATDNYYEAFRLQGAIQTCGASFTGGLSLVSSMPASGATGVATNSTVSLTFNHPLDPASVTDTTLPVMVGWNSNAIIAGKYTVSGATATFTPDSPFPTNTTIYVGNCNGPYDVAGDTYPGCYGTQLVSFTTGGTAVAPASSFQVKAFTPAAGSTNVGLRAPVVATFNRSFNPNTINYPTTDFALFTGDAPNPCTSYSRSQDNASLQFNCYPLPASSTLTAALNSGLQDMSGNPLTNFTSQFTTTFYDSTTNGSVVATRPGNAATGISENAPLTLYLSLPVNSSTANNSLQVVQNQAPITGTVQVLDGGYTLQFTPSSPFTPGALIQWYTTPGFSDSTYNNLFYPAYGYFTIAADTSTETPVVQAASPAQGTYYIPLNSLFDIQFNTPLNPATVNSSTIYLYDNNTGLNLTGAYSMPQPNVVRIVPSSNLSPNDYIYVYITSGVQSTSSVPATATQWYDYTGTAADTSHPTLVSAVPYNGAGNVGVNVTPGAVFSKAIDPVSVNSSTFQVLNGATPLAGAYWISMDDTEVQFVPSAPLPASTHLTMKIAGLEDPEGHAVNLTTSFQTSATPDFTSPTVVATSVSNGESIPVNSAITIQFSESMDITTFNSNNLHIYDYLLGTVIPATISWSVDQSVAYLVPAAPLAAGREYNLYIESGADLAGNSLQGLQLNFYGALSSSSTAPTVSAFNPLYGATGVGTNTLIEAQFTAPVDPNTLSGVTLTKGGGTVAATVSLGAGNSVLYVTPDAPLTANSTYLLTIAGVKDPAGNLVATVTNTFTTGPTFDLVGPSVVSYDPPNYGTVGTNISPKIVFDKPLNPLTVSNSTFTMHLNDTGQFIPLTVTPSANGLEVTLQPQFPLLPNTLYYFQAYSFTDQNGNPGNGLTSYFYTGSGAVVTGPTVTVSPAPNSTGIPLNTEVIVSVSAPIDVTSWNQGSIQLLDSSSNPVAGAVSLTSPQTLVFAPAAALSPGATYTVKVSGFSDTNGNAVVPFNSSFSTGAAAATGGLTLTNVNIPAGATGVSATQAVVLTFSQILDPATVNSSTLGVYVNGGGNDGLAGTYAVSGNQVTFTPTSPYPAGALLYVYSCGGPTDVLGEVYQNGGCYDYLDYFYVISGSPDTTPLQVVSVNPASEATNVRHDISVAVTFNKSVNPGSAYNNAILYAGQDTQDSTSFSWSADNRTLYFSTGALHDNTTYTVALPAGGITDMSGNALAANFLSTFTTATNLPNGNSSVTTTSPGANASGVPTDSLLTLYVNQPVDASTLTGNLVVTVNGQVYAGTVAAVASGYEVQYTPSVPFPAGATVQWFFSNVYDVNGNAVYADSGIFYIQPAVDSATASPQVVSVSPAFFSTNVPTNAQIDIEYNLPIDASTLNGNVYFYSPAVTATVALVAPNVVRLTPSAPLAASTGYSVCANSSVLGTNGVPAQPSCLATSFTTTAGKDTTAGTLTVGPPNGSVNVGTNGYVRLNFSKPVDRTTVNSGSVQVTSGGSAIPGTWTFYVGANYTSSYYYDTLGAAFTPVNPLPPSSTVQVSVSGLLDYAGNEFNEPTTQFTTAALPDFTAANVALDFPYNTAGIATSASFTCRYSKPMDPSSITPGGTNIYDYATGTYVPAGYTFSSDLMSVTMKPNSLLDANTQYSYNCYYAIDLTGNAQNNNYGYFTTGSSSTSTGPKLIEANPPKNFINVPLNTNNGPFGAGTSLGLLFNVPLAENSLGNITLTPNGGSPIPITVSQAIGDTEVTVQLPDTLQPNTTYTYNISGLTDYNGHAMTPVTSSFTTGASFDYVNPLVSGSSPANGATGVSTSASVVLTFTKAMNPVLIDGNHIYLQDHNTQTLIPTTFTISPNYTTVTLKPNAALSSGTIYDLVTGSPYWYLTDIAGNPYYPQGIIATFTTAP